MELTAENLDKYFKEYRLNGLEAASKMVVADGIDKDAANALLAGFAYGLDVDQPEATGYSLGYLAGNGHGHSVDAFSLGYLAGSVNQRPPENAPFLDPKDVDKEAFLIDYRLRLAKDLMNEALEKLEAIGINESVARGFVSGFCSY